LCELFKRGELVPVCPELLGGLGIPREKIELTGDGVHVLAGKAQAVTKSGRDVTQQLVEGARKVLRIAKWLKVDGAILKSRSPSCGLGGLLNGTFSGRHVKRDGVLAALLKRHRIKVVSEAEFE
jgi:uncharacterized protein YbbK (DUF523 family)